MASDFIEHSLKLLLLNNGYTYKKIKEQFGHDFKKMYYALTESEQKDISGILSYFNENYLQSAARQNSDFRDVIKYTQEEKIEMKRLTRYADLCVKQDLGEKLTSEELEYLEKYAEQKFSEENLNNRNSVYEKNNKIYQKNI